MTPLVSEKIESFAVSHTAPESKLFRELVRETYARTKIPHMQVGRVEGAFLRLLVRLMGARHVVEIGTFTGYSALAMAEGLPEDGRLTTCDVDPEATKIALAHWTKSPHGHKIELRLGPALETLKGLSGPFDMAFIDADKENYVNYWDAVVPKVRAGGLIVADNVLWSGRVLAPKEKSDHAIVAFDRRAATDPRVETVLLTVRDGILLAYKR